MGRQGACKTSPTYQGHPRSIQDSREERSQGAIEATASGAHVADSPHSRQILLDASSRFGQPPDAQKLARLPGLLRM
jgi:hypothetical protein